MPAILAGIVFLLFKNIVRIDMKKITILIICLVASIYSVFPQDNYKEPAGNMKSVFLDAGYDFNGASFALGFRYWNLGLSIGAAGLGATLPEHTNQFITLTDAKETFTYHSIWVTTDLYYFYDINDEFTAFANIGYGVGSDSLLATKRDENTGRKYILGSENHSSVTFGAGLQYFFQNQIGVAVGYHNKRGVYAQISYYWY